MTGPRTAAVLLVVFIGCVIWLLTTRGCQSRGRTEPPERRPPAPPAPPRPGPKETP